MLAVDAINSTHSAELTATQVAAAHSQLAAYIDRFRAQLAPGALNLLSQACLASGVACNIYNVLLLASCWQFACQLFALPSLQHLIAYTWIHFWRRLAIS